MLNSYLYDCMIYENTHKSSIFSILGENTPKHESKGNKFYNQNNWTCVFLLRAICRWSKETQSKKLKNKTIKEDWQTVLSYTNSQFNDFIEKKIVIAQTPDNLDTFTIKALIGGAYHEAWHSLYDYTAKLTIDDIDKELYSLLNNLKWHDFEEDLEIWNNIISDVRIENLGTTEFPGTLEKMEILQEFIWNKESQNLESIPPPRIIMGSFRELGFGYTTPCANGILDFYKRPENRQYFNIVDSGPLTHLLLKTKNLTRTDYLGSVKISLQVVKILNDIEKENKDIPEDIDEDSQDEIIPENIPTPTENKDVEEDLDLKIETSSGLELLGTHEKIKDYADSFEIEFSKENNVWQRPETILIEKASVHPLAIKGEIKKTLDTVKMEISHLRNKIKNKLYADKTNIAEYYTKSSITLSDKNIVESFTMLKNKITPNKAFTRKDEDKEINAACGIALDFSSSMISQYLNLIKITLLITDIMEFLNCKTFIYSYQKLSAMNTIKHIIFKEFEENFKYNLEKLGSIRFNLVGTTPTGDAIKYGRECLNRRLENKKMLFVVTDGQPDPSQKFILAKELRDCTYPIIGIGLGEETRFVVDKFKYSAWAKDFKDLPNEIIKVIYKVFKN